MATWKGIIGKSFSPKEFETYCKGLKWDIWKPTFITLHNTYVPTLTQRPNGFTKQHMLNFQSFYKDQQKWSAGPHLFIDDKAIWVFTPLTVSGIHSPSWNKTAIGIEMLGDYEKESFSTGRGLEVRKNAVAAIAILNKALNIKPNTLMLHREDKKTTHKTCPGKNVIKSEVIKEVEQYILQLK